jgi:hypothetical protein
MRLLMTPEAAHRETTPAPIRKVAGRSPMTRNCWTTTCHRIGCCIAVLVNRGFLRGDLIHEDWASEARRTGNVEGIAMIGRSHAHTASFINGKDQSIASFDAQRRFVAEKSPRSDDRHIASARRVNRTLNHKVVSIKKGRFIAE